MSAASSPRPEACCARATQGSAPVVALAAPAPSRPGAPVRPGAAACMSPCSAYLRPWPRPPERRFNTRRSPQAPPLHVGPAPHADSAPSGLRNQALLRPPVAGSIPLGWPCLPRVRETPWRAPSRSSAPKREVKRDSQSSSIDRPPPRPPTTRLPAVRLGGRWVATQPAGATGHSRKKSRWLPSLRALSHDAQPLRATCDLSLEQ